MGWVTLTLRKETLRSQINSKELEDLKISHKARMVTRYKTTEESVLKTQESVRLEEIKEETGYNDAKEAYMELMANDEDQDTSSSEYKQALQDAQNEFTAAKALYDEEKENLENYIDREKEDIESECTRKENILDEEQTEIESQLEAMKEELQSTTDGISSDIESSKLDMGN